MPIETKGVKIYSAKVIVDADSTYNAILGKPSLHEMMVVPSSYHHMVKFLTSIRVEVLRSDQVNALSFRP